MKRIFALSLMIVGIILVLSVVTVGAEQSPPIVSEASVSLPPEGAEYVGSDSCFQCHSNQHRDWSETLHPKMIQDVSENPEAVIADFSIGEEFRQGEGSEAYTLEDVVLTLGTKYRQRYIGLTEDGIYTVLPGQWNRDAAEWVTATPNDDWMKNCAGCHTTGFSFEERSFVELGVGCESCHGPASVHVETAQALPADVDPYGDDVYALRQTIVTSVDAATCGQCHTRGMSPDGEHGYPVGYVVGGPLDETHFIPVVATGEADDPRFWPDGTEKMHRQSYLAWLDSGHAHALTTITEGARRDSCLSCHSTDYARQDTTFPQDAITIDNAQFGVTCVHCHAPHGGTDNADQLAGESYRLCADCHQGTDSGNRPIRVGNTVHHAMREMFEGVPFLGLSASPSFHFANEAYGPICASCHMVGTAKSAEVGDIGTHSFNIILPTSNAEGQPDSCTVCHDGSHDEMTPDSLLFYIEETQADTRDRIDLLREDLEFVQGENPDWDPASTEKSAEQVMAERIHTLLSFIEADGSWGLHNPEYTNVILNEAENLMDDLFDALDL